MYCRVIACLSSTAVVAENGARSGAQFSRARRPTAAEVLAHIENHYLIEA
jgi:hypothetical protein